MNLLQVPIAVELFRQWRTARGERETAARRPFSRRWEELLEATGIDSASDRRDAEHDARELATAGWITLKSVPLRPQLLERIAIPLEQETGWCRAFGYVAPTDDTARLLREFAWEPALAFLTTARVTLPLAELQALNAWLARPAPAIVPVPIKERSLEIFGDEKRLDGLLNSSLFDAGRLTTAALGCFLASEPLGWKRGPATAVEQPVLILENAATWHSYDQWNQVHGHFSAVVYGGGNRFRDSVTFLSEIFRELGGPRRILYFGDLDPAGLRIPRLASHRAVAAGLPPVEPHLWSYRQLWTFQPTLPPPTEVNSEPTTLEAADLAWLGEFAETVHPWLSAGRRLAQEHIGWTHLQRTHATPAEILPPG